MEKNSRDTGTQKGEGRGPRGSGFSPADTDVERRARELALTANRPAVNDAERERARLEFRDRDLPDAVNEDADSMQSRSRDPSDPVTDRGRQAPEYGLEDEKAALEHLALEGVEEAQHDQMLAAHNEIDEPLRLRPKGKK